MSKPTLQNDSFNYQELTGYALAMTIFSLLVAWGIEFLAKELIRLG